MNKKFFQFSLCLVCSVSIYSQTHLLSSPSGTIKNNLATDSSFQKFKTDNTSINDHYIYIDINQVKMYLSNNGDGSHDPRTGNGGFYWPGGLSATQTAIFEDGLIWGGKVDGDIRVNGNTHRQGLQAGKILSNGKADDPKLPRYRVFKIRKDWESFPPGPERDSFEKDYKEWPIEDGAPWTDMNGDGIYTTGTDQPRFDGDEVLWYVANDMDSARTKRTFGKPPMGLEEQCAIFGFNRDGYLGDMIFKKYKVINKGAKAINEMYLAYWSDTDLGTPVDDFTGCDTLLSLGYTYNAGNTDNIYGTPPPACGYVLLQGPLKKGAASDSGLFNYKWIAGYKNIPLTSFIFYIGGSMEYADPIQGDTAGSTMLYNNILGLSGRTGGAYTDPNTKLATKFLLSGDPVAGTGWYEGKGFPGGPNGGDRRHLMSMGPFEMAPGDTQEVVIGIIMARGTSNLNSISVLKDAAKQARGFYLSSFSTTSAAPSDRRPEIFSLQQNYPNPFNPITTISYSIPKLAQVEMKVYDMLGREVIILVNREQSAGEYKVQFDGSSLPSGVYIYTIQAGSFRDSKKLLLLK